VLRVDGTPGSALVGDEICHRPEVHGYAKHHAGHAILPGRIERDSIDTSADVDANRRNADLVNDVRLRKRICRDAVRG
jgi:hypothetical protein